jgi:hypothetical protein
MTNNYSKGKQYNKFRHRKQGRAKRNEEQKDDSVNITKKKYTELKINT